MTDNRRSSLVYRSNLQPRTGLLRQDRAFLENVWDIGALSILKDNHVDLPPAQEKVYSQVGAPCAYAARGDFPFGTVRSADGGVRVKCLCSNTACALFTTCRPDADPHTFRKPESLVTVRCSGAAPVVLKRQEPGLRAEKDQNLRPAGTDMYAEFMARADPPDSLFLEAEYAAVLWPEDLGVLRQLLAQAHEEGRQPEEWTDGWELDAEKTDGWGLDAERTDDWDLELDAEGVPAGIPAEFPQPPLSGPKITSAKRLIELLEQHRRQSWQRRFRQASQNDIISSGSRTRIIVNAGPGTGKTWTLVERIVALIQSGAAAPEEIQVLCYSRSARQVVMERLRQAAEAGRLSPGWVDVSIHTFDSYAAHMLLFLRDSEPSWLPCPAKAVLKDGYDATIGHATDAVRKHPEILQGLRHLIVDEIQDLVGVRADFLLALAGALPPESGFTFFGDSCQAIFDYSVGKAGELKADDMYLALLKEHSDASLLSFGENRRSCPAVAALAVPLRKAILSGNSENMRIASSQVAGRTEPQNLTWRPQQTASQFTCLTRAGSLGLLTRTNGQALAVSTALHAADVQHSVLLTGAEEHLDGWIGRLLTGYDAETMDASDFAQAFGALYPQVDPQPYWEALTEKQRVAQDRYEVRDLLSRLRGNAARLRSLGHEELLAAPDCAPCAVCVMTIHRAKGREFETVLVPEKALTTPVLTKDERKRLEESRVSYVAITRARSALGSIALPRGAGSIHKLRRSARSAEAPDRWYYRTAKGMRAFEVGAAADIDPKSYAADAAVQDYLRNCAVQLPGMELELRRRDDAGLTYVLTDRDNPNTILGFTDIPFEVELGSLLEPTAPFRRRLAPPDSFHDIYVQRVATFVGPAAGAPPGARLFGDTAVWLGLEISGLAKAVYDRY